MLKRRSILSAVVAMLMFFAVGCGKEQQPVASSGNQQVTSTTAPTEVEEPVATPTPEATPTPTEVPTPTVDPLSIPSLDQFEKYESHEESFAKALSGVKYPNCQIVVRVRDVETDKKKVLSILSDGDSFEQISGYEGYAYILYTPDLAKDVECDNEILYAGWVDDEEYKFGKYFLFQINDGITGKDIELPFKITYEDGSEETITIYVTKE